MCIIAIGGALVGGRAQTLGNSTAAQLGTFATNTGISAASGAIGTALGSSRLYDIQVMKSASLKIRFVIFTLREIILISMVILFLWVIAENKLYAGNDYKLFLLLILCALGALYYLWGNTKLLIKLYSDFINKKLE